MEWLIVVCCGRGLLLTNVFGIKVVRRGPNKLYRGPKCIYLVRWLSLGWKGAGGVSAAGADAAGVCVCVSMFQCNHRSWCDFFLDAVLTDGRAAVLTRCVSWVSHCGYCQGQHGR